MTGQHIKIGDKVQTRDGRPRRILCIDLQSPKPLLALDEHERAIRYTADGRVCASENIESPDDLVLSSPPAAKRFRVGDAVQTRDGRKARIVCDDAKNSDSLVALVTDDDEEVPYCYPADGIYYGDRGSSLHDLIPAPRRQTVWIIGSTVNGELDPFIATVKPDRHTLKLDGFSFCKRIELEEGQFDD